MEEAYWEKLAWLHLFHSRRKDSTTDQSILIILKESKALHKELLKMITPCTDTKDNARQGHFYLESVFHSSTISIQTLAPSRYIQILIFLQIHLVTQLKLKVDEMWIKDHSVEILGSELNFNHYSFRRHSRTLLKMKGALEISSSHPLILQMGKLTWGTDRSAQPHGH